MSDVLTPNPEAAAPAEAHGGRAVGGTEYSWCRAVTGGTGITVLALLLSRSIDFSVLQTALEKLCNSHPILRSKLRSHPSFSFVTPPSAPLVETLPADSPLSFHQILESEINHNAWGEFNRPMAADTGIMSASAYTIEESKCVVVLRLHTAACDRTAAVFLLRELMKLMSGGGGGGGVEGKDEVSLGIEDLVPEEKSYKPFWARGMDVLGYSLNSLRLANLGFCDAAAPRHSEVVRLQVDPARTARILDGCKSRGIKLCGALSAAGMIAARSAKDFSDNLWEKYSVVTLMDCRSLLHPPLPAHQLGFYHSAIQNTHDVNGEETLWDLATRTYTSFANSKNCNKHFTDMGDLNFLMCKAMDAPALTPSSSLRTCFISVFEDPVFEHTNDMHRSIGVEDYVGCASVHGVGPSVAIFDTIRDGRLDCACVYPAPLHSREQMQRLVEDMKRVLCGDE